MNHLQTVRAYYHRLRIMDFWSQRGMAKAEHFFNQWLAEALRIWLAPVIKVPTLWNHLGRL